MINIRATIPEGNAKRLYSLEVNGFKFIFEVENDDQIGKRPLEILYDELRVIVGLIEKHLGVNQEEVKELPEKKITLEDLKNGEENI